MGPNERSKDHERTRSDETAPRVTLRLRGMRAAAHDNNCLPVCSLNILEKPPEASSRTVLFASKLLFDVVVYGLCQVVLHPNDSIPLCQHVVLDEPKTALSALL